MTPQKTIARQVCVNKYPHLLQQRLCVFVEDMTIGEGACLYLDYVWYHNRRPAWLIVLCVLTGSTGRLIRTSDTNRCGFNLHSKLWHESVKACRARSLNHRSHGASTLLQGKPLAGRWTRVKTTSWNFRLWPENLERRKFGEKQLENKWKVKLRGHWRQNRSSYFVVNFFFSPEENLGHRVAYF